MNSSNQHFGEGIASKLSPNGVLDGLNISRHPEGAERNPQSFCYCDALMNIPVIAGMTRNRITGADSEENVPLAENRIPSPLEESDLRAEGLRRSRARISRASQDRVRGKKAAFTLSEVLITLGVIGVVAALVMGVIIPQIQDRQNIAKWKKEYSIVSNAFQQILSEGTPICMYYNSSGACTYGDNGYLDFSKEFVDSFMSKVRVVDSCSQAAENRCDNFNYPTSWQQARAKYKWSGMASNHSRYKALGVRTESNPGTYSPYGVLAYNFNSWAILLNDGAVVYFGGLWGGPWACVDVNGFQTGPNEVGRDFFCMNAYSNIKTNTHWLRPAGAQGTAGMNDSSNGITGCSKDIGKQGANTIYAVAGIGCSAQYLGNY